MSENTAQKASGTGTTYTVISGILALISLCGCVCCAPLSIVTAIAGAACGWFGRKETRDTGTSLEGLANVAFWANVVLAVLAIGVTAFGLASQMYQSYFG